MSLSDVNLNEDWGLLEESELMKKDVMLGYGNPVNSTPITSTNSTDISESTQYTTPATTVNLSSSESSSSSADESDVESSNPKYKLLTIKNGKDVDSIPITRDGMAVCEKCGTIGVKHAFYSKSKRFCSLSCSKSYCDMEREGKPIPRPKPVFKFPLTNVKIKKKPPPPPKIQHIHQTTFVPNDTNASFTWHSYLKKQDFKAVPVSSFKHAPLSDVWDNIMVGMKVEVENRDDGDLRELFPHTYWVASVMAVAGYKVLLRYEGFGSDNREDFWVNLCKQHVQPVGWCASQGKPLIPPRSIQRKCQDWKQFLVKRLTGARTLPSDFHEKVSESIVSRFKPGMQLEVVDKNCISSVCLAFVQEVIGGRLHVRYHGSESWDDGFWCHEKSPLIHPIGWAHSIGHNVNMSQEYAKLVSQKSNPNLTNDNEATWDMFNHPQTTSTSNLKFREGMKLEAIDPLNLSAICVATVMKVLKKGFLMIGIDGYNERGSDWFCHHSSSGSIFPAGFCELNQLNLTIPKECRSEFKWQDYLRAKKAIVAPAQLFHRDLPNHGFQAGMHLEAVDLMEPGLICVGTITKVVGRLLRVHFDGWNESYDQWCDCDSPDLYPVGWCELVDYHLESPKANDQEKKRKTKTPSYKGVRKKKRVRLPTFGKQKESTHVSPNKEEHVIVQTIPDLPLSVEKEHCTNVGSQTISASSSLEVQQLAQHKTTEESEAQANKTIPRLIDNISSSSSSITLTTHHSVITPELWTIFDVSQFLRINDCAAYCETFSKKRIDGKKFLTLTKEQIVNLTGKKVGPSVKIYELIQQLKAKSNIA